MIALRKVRFFRGNQYSTPLVIEILDDNITEPQKTFSLRYDIPEGLENKIKKKGDDHHNLEITILDDDCKFIYCRTVYYVI